MENLQKMKKKKKEKEKNSCKRASGEAVKKVGH